MIFVLFFIMVSVLYSKDENRIFPNCRSTIALQKPNISEEAYSWSFKH